MKTKPIQFIGLCLLVLVAGVFWGTWFTLTRSIEDFSIEEFIHIGKVIIANVALPMKIIMPSCILFIAASLWLYPNKHSSGFYFHISAFILILVTLLVTVLILVPIDNNIKLWTASTAPSDWQEIRSRWQFFHTVRTFTSLTSFGCMTISLLKTRD